MTATSTRRLELYCRAETMGLAGRRQDAIETRARELAATDAVDELDVIATERKPSLGAHGPQDPRAIAAFGRFREWADETGVRLHPAFDTRECYSWETGRPYTALVVPVVALAVYEDDALVAVYPHGTDPHRSVFDGLCAIETGGLPAPTDEDRALVPAE
ncbi:HTH domain-containing protein [Halorientalis marina]|jgi:hypothetical protein|uniref:HTH domain-containing protein n=1 Tax=Halorientalis marina TaxID=2931976 RepID=UPI001FF3E09E|nr:HTH domain-containing protein [Halorientalis marina]